MGEALEAARSIQSESFRASALSGLAQYQPELMGEALEAARSIQSESSRASALSALAQYLPKQLMEEALEAAQSIQSESSRASVLSALAQYLPKELMENISSIVVLKNPYHMALALSGLIKNTEFKEIQPLRWIDILKILGNADRKAFFSDLPYLADIVQYLTNSNIELKAVNAAIEVCKQWP